MIPFLTFQTCFRRTKTKIVKRAIYHFISTFELKLTILSCKRRIPDSKILSFGGALWNISFFTSIQTFSAYLAANVERGGHGQVEVFCPLYCYWMTSDRAKSSCKTHVLESCILSATQPKIKRTGAESSARRLRPEYTHWITFLSIPMSRSYGYRPLSRFWIPDVSTL